MADGMTTVEDGDKTSTALDTEARRLLEFKKEHIRKGNMTPCPECATLISVDANKCPHCTSDIGDYNRNIRAELARLNELSAQLYDLHRRQMELYQHEAAQKPLWSRSGELLADPQVVQDLKVVLPTLVSFFALILFLRSVAGDLVFWPVSVGGAALVYMLLKKWRVSKYLTVDLYRSILVIGTAIVMVASLDAAMRLWPEVALAENTQLGDSTREVMAASANIRAEPTTDSGVVTTASQGEDLRILDESGPWYQVTTVSGQTGWIHSSLVR